MSEPLLSCSFCRKSQRDVRKLIAGPSVQICNECVDICIAVLEDGEGEIGTVSAPVVGYAPNPAPHVAATCAICQEPVPIEHSMLVRDRARVCGTCLDAITAE